MGLQDRSYYDEQGRDPWSSDPDPWSSDPDAWKGGSAGSKRYSIITILIVINVAIFLVDAFTPISQDRLEQYKSRVEKFPEKADEFQKPGRWLSGALALKPDVLKKPWNIWQFLTHGFAHASIDSKLSFYHVAFNMVTLFFLGRPVEKRYGRHEFLRFYLLAIVVSGLGWMIAQWITGEANSRVVGASGAVSAVVALFIMNFWNESIQVFGVIRMKAWILGAVLIFLDLLRAFDPSNSVAWQAHLVGMAFGAAYFQFKWNFNWMKFDRLSELTKSKPKLKVHNPGASGDDLREQGDRILEKIQREGRSSLTSKEERILKKYSKRIQEEKKRERES